MSHPPYLTSSWSSAFIPFCAYKTNLNFTEKSFTLNGINIAICSAFVPTILEGQLCYKLTLNEKSKQGMKNELMLLLDNNEERSLQVHSNKTADVKSKNGELNFEIVGSIQGSSAKVQINTLSPYINFGGGIFTTSVVKRMTAKEDFLRMELKDRNCEVEVYGDCSTRKLFEICNCAPWEVSWFQVPNLGMP